MMDSRHAAKLMPTLSALYGPKDKVFQYPMGLVLREIKADIDDGRFQDYFSHEYGKIMESEAKARRRGKR